MNNIDYLKNIGINKDNLEKMLKVLDKYKDNKWWLSVDLNILGYYQLNEPILLIGFGKFHEAITHLLQRPVFTHEFALNYEGLIKEADIMFSRI